MEKLRLLLVAPIPPPYGGIGNWTLLMKKYIDSREDIELVGVLNTAPKQRSLDGRKWYERIVVQGLSMIKQAVALDKRIKEEHPSVVHITTSGQLATIRDVFFMRICRRRKVRILYHLHFGRIPEIVRKDTREWRTLKKAIRLSDVTVAIDKKTESVIKEDFGEKVTCIANPFDVSSTQKYPGTKTKKEVLFLGWCVKTKGIEELLEAWDTVVREHPEWQLRIVGPVKSAYYEELRKRFAFQNVSFEGEKQHNEAMQLMSETGILVLPSYTEGFPTVILEAMAFKKPIVATNVGAIPEMLSDNCGLIIRAREVADISEALIKLIRNEELRNILANSAYKRLCEEYAIEVVYEKYLQIWNGGALE